MQTGRDEGLVQHPRVIRLASAAGELRWVVAGADARHLDLQVIHAEIDAPVLHGQREAPVPAALDAPIGMRLRAQHQRVHDALAQRQRRTPRDPGQLRISLLAETHVEMPAGIGGTRRQPATARIGKGIGVGDVGLDVEHGRVVDHVDVAHVQEAIDRTSRTTERPMGFGRCGDRVARTPRRSRAARGQHLGPPTFVAVEAEDHPEVLPAFEILTACSRPRPARTARCCPGRLGGGGWLPGRIDPVGERGANLPDGV